MGRRGHGEGSIHQRKDGRWVAVLDLGRGPDGRRRRKYFYGKRKSEVQQALLTAQAELAQGQLPADSRLTVQQYLERWLEHMRDQVRPKTWAGYHSICRHHLIPALGRIRLEKLTALHVQEMLTTRRRQGYGDKPLSPRQLAYIHGVLHRALARAVKWRLVPRNVAADADPPRQERREMATLTREQARDLLVALEGQRLQVLYLVALATGARQGELLALRWPDLDLDAGTMTIRATLQRQGNAVQLQEPKTAKSRRTIALSPGVVAALRAHRQQQLQERLLWGPDYQDQGFVFAHEDGRPLRPEFVTRTLQRILARHGLPQIRFHDLRHTYASLQVHAGENIKVVSDQLGHTTVRFTLDQYTHTVGESQRRAAVRMDQILFGPKETKKQRRGQR